MNSPVAIVLAAGKGTRMKTELPKVMVEVLGRPMLEFVLKAVGKAGIDRSLVVVGHRAELVRDHFADAAGVSFVDQPEQLGTGHAVQMCRDHLAGHDGAVLVVAGDSPLLQPSSVAALLEVYDRERPACVLGTRSAENPAGLGRIVRDEQGEFMGIVEDKDATPQQKQITEVNMSTYVFDCRSLLAALDRLKNNNRQGEYYLTDCPGILLGEGRTVKALPVLKPCEALSINTVDELATVEAEMRRMGYQ